MSQVKILDYTALVNLRASLKEFSESFKSPLESIEQELNDTLQMMEKKLEYFKKAKEHAEEQLSHAESKLRSCEDSQEWDEEEQCYRPSCKWERSSVELARSTYENACKKLEMAEDIYKQVDYEITQYLKPFGIIQIGGAADYLRKEMSSLSEADDKMEKILGLVERYLGSKTSPGGTEKTPSEVRTELIKQAAEKKDKFAIASREVSATIEEGEEDVYGVDINNENERKNAISQFNENKCRYCGRPLKICICGRGQRELERY